MQALTIQQVAQQTGLSVHTLRYYERNGLLEPVNRASSGHRRYLADDVARIEFLTRLRATGMPIRQMQEFAQLFRERPEAIADRRAILEAHKQQVQAHIQELQLNLAVIDWKINYYKQLEANVPQSESHERQDCLTAGRTLILEHTFHNEDAKPEDSPHRNASPYLS